jgi:hypothetical protein
MTTAKWTINNTREQQDLHYSILLQYLMKRSVCGLRGWRCSLLHWCSVYDPDKIFFTSKFSYLLFSNLTHKTETGTTNWSGTTNSKPPGSIIMIGQSEMLTTSQIICITHSFIFTPLNTLEVYKLQ